MLLLSLEEALNHLVHPICHEIIIVDQNEDNKIEPVVEEFANRLNISHNKVLFRGVSRARNYGVSLSHGDIVCFPDDDSEFSPNTIETAFSILETTQCDVLFGKSVDKTTKKDSMLCYSREAAWLSLQRMENCFIEFTMFSRRHVFEAFQYDERMGPGILCGSEEGYDLVYRLLQSDVKIYYSPEVVFYHPQKVKSRSTAAEVRRAFHYSCGMGHLCRKHRLNQKYRKRFGLILLYLPYCFVFRHRQFKYFLAKLIGLYVGYKIVEI